MSFFHQTQWVIDMIDQLRISFFLWAGSREVSGARCLVSWAKVCTLRECGPQCKKISVISTPPYLLNGVRNSSTSIRLLGLISFFAITIIISSLICTHSPPILNIGRAGRDIVRYLLFYLLPILYGKSFAISFAAKNGRY